MISCDDHSDKKPSNEALSGTLAICRDWTNWIADLGVPLDKALALQLKLDPIIPNGFLALQYWRDGKSGDNFPPTWKFLLDTVEKAKGPEVAQQILVGVKQNERSWCVS